MTTTKVFITQLLHLRREQEKKENEKELQTAMLLGVCNTNYILLEDLVSLQKLQIIT